MTQTIALNSCGPEINPLYIKLRQRFACQGDRTIGEVKAQQAIRDGYQPYAAPARRPVSAHKTTAAYHATRANALPKSNTQDLRVRSSRLSGSAVLAIILCAVLLMFMLLSGLKIAELNNELNNGGGNALSAEEVGILVSPAPVNEAAAEDGTAFSNLLRAFSEK